MRTILLLTVLALAGAGVVVHQLPSDAVAQSTPSTYQPTEVRSVSIDGRGLPLAALREAITTKPHTTFDRSALAADRATLQHMLETRGFLQAKVSDPTVTYQGNGVFVVFPIERGAEFHVRDVKLVGVEPSNAGIVTIGAWDTANPERIERVRQALENAHVGHVSATLETDAAASAVDVTFIVSR